jgi:TPR repeat protein
MHLVGMCYQSGAGGAPDKAKAEAALSAAAAEWDFPSSKCALGRMLMPSRTAGARARPLPGSRHGG